jgi:hypothetical protein
MDEHANECTTESLLDEASRTLRRAVSEAISLKRENAALTELLRKKLNELSTMRENLTATQEACTEEMRLIRRLYEQLTSKAE